MSPCRSSRPCFFLAFAFVAAAAPAHAELPNPILFVTQMPIAEDGATIGSIFANHLPDTFHAGRGGDLYILYPDQSLRNLTREAGFGAVGFQGEGSIAVRNPAVHFSGTRGTFYDTTEVPQASAGHTGSYRNPLPLSDGTLIAVHTPHTTRDANLGTDEQPDPRFDLRLRSLVSDGPYPKAGAPLTPGIVATVSYWSYGFFLEYSGPMWELDPVEVVSRPAPLSKSRSCIQSRHSCWPKSRSTSKRSAAGSPSRSWPSSSAAT